MYMELAILTKSSKRSGYCVAGINIKTGEWIRLTSEDKDSHGALFKKDMQYEDKSECQILDIVRVKITDKNPSKYQPENVLIDKDSYWERQGKLSIKDVLKLHPPEDHKFIFLNERSYITKHEIDSIGYSLILIYAEELFIVKDQNKTKVNFRYGSNQYKYMSVTDTNYYDIPNGTKIEKAILVISLPDNPYKDRYYKFVSQIYEL